VECKYSFYTVISEVLAYSVLVIVCILIFSVLVVHARETSGLMTGYNNVSMDNSHMFLSADELVFDSKTGIITARGQVQIEDGGNKIVARHVTYNKITHRFTADGNVEIVDINGIKVYADKIDLTDDLGEGFINSLRVETRDHIRFTAESAERSRGWMTVFNNGIYTTCQSCDYKRGKPVIWQIKAKRIIWHKPTETIRFENSWFEMFGQPIAWLPIFEIKDPKLKRKSGILVPRLEHTTGLGVNLTNSYFWNIAPNYDLTLSVTEYLKRGMLIQEIWRHHLESGFYNLRFAHIYDHDSKDSPLGLDTRNKKNRYMVGTQGKFVINTHWIYGWEIMAQSDQNFSRTYNLDGYSNDVHRSQVYLTGLADRNYFGVKFYHFTLQENTLQQDAILRQDSRQPWVLPRIDYTFIPDARVLGGELKFTANLQTIYREKTDRSSVHKGIPLNYLTDMTMTGTSVRFTVDLEWKRSLISNYGLVLSPLFSLRSDAISIHPDESYQKIDMQSDVLRSMATAGLEVRYPVLLSYDKMTHIVEPVAQILLRSDERYAGQLVNEDAQSFVFDATTLFSRDKFSGYDRIEGGSRINIGMRYSGDTKNGWSVYSLLGQSYHLAGKNSFSSDKIIGTDSGLETARSDYVTMLGIDDSNMLSIAARGRFDEKNMSIRRGEIELQKQWKPLAVGLQYAYIERQPSYGYAQNRQEISARSSYKLDDKWQMNADAIYDIFSETLVQTGSGVSYQDECFGLIFNYQKTRNPGERTVSHKWNIFLSFRTLGDFGSKTSFLQ